MWTVIVGIGVLVGIVAGVTQVWDVFRKDSPPVVQHDVVTQVVAPPASAAPPCRSSSPARSNDHTNFAVCVSSNLELNGQGEVRAFPGAWVLVNIEFVNTGTTQIDGVVLRAQLDRGMRMEQDSARLIWSSQPGGTPLGADATDALGRQGVNVGSYASRGNGYLSFYVKVADPDQYDCGTSRRVISAHADTEAGSKGADIVLAVVRQC